MEPNKIALTGSVSTDGGIIALLIEKEENFMRKTGKKMARPLGKWNLCTFHILLKFWSTTLIQRIQPRPLLAADIAFTPIVSKQDT